jgi:hypothetical protein
MATEKQLAAVAKMREAKAKKALEKLKENESKKKPPIPKEIDEEEIDNDEIDDDEIDDDEIDDDESNSSESYFEHKDINLGFRIEEELNKLWQSKTTTLNNDSLKSKAKTTYDLIFQSYEKGKKNGVETSNFLLLENEPNNYILKKI